MSEELFALTAEQVDRLRALAETIEAADLGRPERSPHDPRWLSASPPQSYKPLVRFLLDVSLATSQESVAAVVTDQYGVGTENSTSITVYNLLTSVAGTYVFSGSSGAAGLAVHNTSTQYRIVQMECT